MYTITEMRVRMDIINDMINNLKRQSCDLLATIRKISETSYITDIRSFEYLTERLEMLSEKFTCSVRDFAQKTFIVNRYEALDKAGEMQGIEVRKDGNIIVIDLPFLLPKKKGKNHSFIGDPLWHKLAEVSQYEEFKIRGKAVVCIIHTYDNVNKDARCYDYDNLESKKILDIVTLFTLTDDAPEYCDLYQTVKLSNVDKTRILIMPFEEFLSKKTGLIF